MDNLKIVTDPNEDQTVLLLPNQELVIEIPASLCDIDVQGEFLVLSGEWDRNDRRCFYFSITRDMSSYISNVLLGEICIYGSSTVALLVVMVAPCDFCFGGGLKEPRYLQRFRRSFEAYKLQFHDIVMKQKEGSIEDDCLIKDF